MFEQHSICGNQKKNPTESYRSLQKTCPEYAPSYIHQIWFTRFKRGDLDGENQERLGHGNKFEDEESKE